MKDGCRHRDNCREAVSVVPLWIVGLWMILYVCKFTKIALMHGRFVTEFAACFSSSDSLLLHI